jgi:hypothetical protein
VLKLGRVYMGGATEGSGVGLLGRSPKKIFLSLSIYHGAQRTAQGGVKEEGAGKPIADSILLPAPRLSISDRQVELVGREHPSRQLLEGEFWGGSAMRVTHPLLRLITTLPQYLSPPHCRGSTTSPRVLGLLTYLPASRVGGREEVRSKWWIWG